MPAIKLKINARKGATKENPEAPSKSRKKRRIVGDDDDNEGDNYLTPGSEEERAKVDPGTSGQQPRTRNKRSMSRAEAPKPDELFDDDENVDVVNNYRPSADDTPDRAPTPDAGPSVPSPRKQQRRGSTLTSRRKAAAIYSDDDDDEGDDHVDARRKQGGKDVDDFVVDSPPRKTTAGGKKGGGAGATKGRGGGRGGKEKEKGRAIGEIMIKDERKLSTTATTGDTKLGSKRRRETVTESSAAADVQSATTSGATQAPPATSAPPNAPKEGAPTAPPPSKVRKLPPIKKNKALANAATAAPSSGPSTPSASTSAAPGAKPSTTAAATGASSLSNTNNIFNASAGLPIHTSLPRKPVQKTSDVDLTSPDIYNSLFKTGSGATRFKEEERRRELMKMRDEARAARMAVLQKHTFSLLSPQDKVARFEEKMRSRNSPAVYPNQLGLALKYIVLRRSDGFPVRPLGKRRIVDAGGGGSGNASGSPVTGTGTGVGQGSGG